MTTITGHIAKAERLEANDTEPSSSLFDVSVFATGLGKSRILAVAEDGTAYATRRDTGDAIMLRDRPTEACQHGNAADVGRV